MRSSRDVHAAGARCSACSIARSPPRGRILPRVGVDERDRVRPWARRVRGGSGRAARAAWPCTDTGDAACRAGAAGTRRRRRRSRGRRSDRDCRCTSPRPSAAVLVDADDVSPTVAPRLGLPIEPNLRTAIDAVEHGRGDLRGFARRRARYPVLGAHRSPERQRLGARAGRRGHARDRGSGRRHVLSVVVVDSGGSLDEVGGQPRGRHALARVRCSSRRT